MCRERRAYFTLVVVLMICQLQVRGQPSELDPLYAELDSLFADDDLPDNLFELADSILAIENARVSAVVFRAGYVSQIVSAGRSLGIEQYGFSPAVSWLHHSGFGAGITGYWSSEYTPSYYLTDVEVSYSHTVRKKFTLMLSNDFYLYHDSLTEHSFNKSAQFSMNYQRKHADIGGDYTFLYGNNNAHRVTVRANATIKLRPKRMIIDAITFTPGVAFQWGNADVVYWRQPRTAISDLYWIIRNNGYPSLQRREYFQLAYLLENNREAAAAFFLRQRDYEPSQIDRLFTTYYDGTYQLEDTFGFMNFSVSIPVMVRVGKFNILLNYTWNQPQALPGETFTFQSNSFFSASISYLLLSIKK